MDHFAIIQKFFTRMQCPHCGDHLTEDGIELIRQEENYFLVSVDCHHCDTHVGMAMVGVDSIQGGSDSPGEDMLHGGIRRRRSRRYKDPELTEAELERLADFHPIDYDDVLEAHHFFQNLGRNWMSQLPEPVREKMEREAAILRGEGDEDTEPGDSDSSAEDEPLPPMRGAVE